MNKYQKMYSTYSIILRKLVQTMNNNVWLYVNSTCIPLYMTLSVWCQFHGS